jgi:uncharacterized membrane protein YkgB
MTMSQDVPTATARAANGTGRSILRYGLAAVIGSGGAMKFTDYEVGQIEPLVKHSPLFRWAVDRFGLKPVARAVGVVELSIASMIASRKISPRLATIGSVLAVGMFATTLSFVGSTPGVLRRSKKGVPILSALPGQFLMKDLVLLGAALWTFSETARSARRLSQATHDHS